MKKFYLLPLLLFLFGRMYGQTCSGITITYTATESRCVSTGSVTVSVSGGSGNYNYRVIGPVNTPLTSSNIITGLQAGTYKIQVKDLTNNCISEKLNVIVPGSYSDPRFGLTKVDATCAGNDGSISVTGQQFGRSPFTYKIIAPSPSGVGTTSTTGNFTGLVAGEYAIQLQDSCGGIQVRRITIENYAWWFTEATIHKVGCDSADAYITLMDNKGNVNTSGTAFAGFTYGVIDGNGDTLWFTANEFRFYSGQVKNATVIVKDNCGLIHTATASVPDSQKPTVGTINLTNFTCTTFDAEVTGQQNLSSNVFYCLLDGNNNVLACNSGSAIFNGLTFGSYCISIYDACYDTAIRRCFTYSRPVPGVGATVNITNRTCATFTASIAGQTNLTAPNYCLINSLGDTVECNATGIFSNLNYGNYCISIKNQCYDTTITRCFNAVKATPVITGVSIGGVTCTTFNVSTNGSNLVTPNYCLYDDNGNLITCDSSGVFNGIPLGNYCIRAISCGDTTAPFCFSRGAPIPALGSVSISNKICTGFTATVTGQTNLTNPDFCLFDANDVQISCNTTGVFTNIPYGSYCIKMHDNCTDTTITRCFSQARAIPSVNATIQQTNSTCTTFSATVTGTNLTSPQYCLYDVFNNQVACNTTGVFNNVPYGSYCVQVKDGCVDTTITVCRNFAPVKGLTLSTSKPCSIGFANVTTTFASGNAPYNIKIYHPDGSLVKDTTTSLNPFQLLLPALPVGTKYTVIGTDNCGLKDTATITPAATIVDKSVTVRAKCPSATFVNGAGDLIVYCTSNYYAASPKIINKDGMAFVKSFSSLSGSTYTFSDLEPATYIIEYNMVTCNSKLYDTVYVPPYAYPTAGQSAIYQCDNNSLSLGADVLGGVSPYSYQIIGSDPASPNINTGLQSSPIFTINTGTVYSLVRLRAIDACGNATLDDVSVLPLQNLSITATSLCYFQNITLSVDALPNATYTWYRKTTPTDSVQIGTGADFNLPFFKPEEAGQYVCKVNVNAGCLERITRFDMYGCGGAVLSSSLTLKGSALQGKHLLSWTVGDDTGVAGYTIERKIEGEPAYRELGKIVSKATVTEDTYSFTDEDPAFGRNLYRLKLLYRNGRTGYSNEISLGARLNVSVFPNPV
ncbi:MAG TPA: hypothetical protein VHK91_04375, partial [Flavisolibacter sp.]|nr:hypothetical protein [Flavisolibacter sp.]